MHHGAGPDRTREDHLEIAAQLYAIAARARQAADLAEVVGEDALSSEDRQYLLARQTFEHDFVSQSLEASRSLVETLDRAWMVASMLPRSELSMISPEMVEKYDRDGAADPSG